MGTNKLVLLEAPKGLQFRDTVGGRGQTVRFGGGYMAVQVCKEGGPGRRKCVGFGIIAIKEAQLFSAGMTPSKLRDIKNWKYITQGEDMPIWVNGRKTGWQPNFSTPARMVVSDKGIVATDGPVKIRN